MQLHKELLAEIGREKKIESGKLFGENHSKQEVLSTIDKTSEPHNTRETIATELGWSTGKVAMADKVSEP